MFELIIIWTSGFFLGLLLMDSVHKSADEVVRKSRLD